jgi:hypothetical protein
VHAHEHAGADGAAVHERDVLPAGVDLAVPERPERAGRGREVGGGDVAHRHGPRGADPDAQVPDVVPSVAAVDAGHDATAASRRGAGVP